MTTDVVMLTVDEERFAGARKHLDNQDVDYRGILVNHSPRLIRPDDQWIVLGDGLNHSYAQGLNLAFEHLESDRVLLISDDAHMHPGALQAMLSHDTPIVGSVLLHDGLANHVGAGFADDQWPTHYGRGAPVDDIRLSCHEVDWVTWACVLINRKVIETVGKVDETYWYSHEDVDYGLRAREEGFGRPMLCVDALVEHPEAGVSDAPRKLKANMIHYHRTWIESGRLAQVLA